jgi:hypothetical protein
MEQADMLANTWWQRGGVDRTDEDDKRSEASPNRPLELAWARLSPLKSA